MAGFGDKPRKKADDERLTSYTFKKHVIGDAVYLLPKVMAELGLTFREVSTPKFTPMGQVNVPFRHEMTKDGIDIPYGSYEIDGVGTIRPGMKPDDTDVVPELTLSVAFADKDGTRGRDEWSSLIKALEEALDNTRSLFFGRAITVNSPGDLLIPHYIDVAPEVDLYLNDDVAEAVDDHIFYHIREFELLKRAGVRTQRGVLLHGKYGTGKSLIAYKAAQMAVAAKRTFVLCDMGMMREALQIARYLQPSVMFIEDMDNMSGSGLSNLRNLMSGVDSKTGYDVLAILTTNFLDRVVEIDRSFMRPERIDALIEVTPPTAPLVKRILLDRAGAHMDQAADWDSAAKVIAKDGDTTPAILIEMCARIKVRSLKLARPLTIDEVAAIYESLNYQIKLSRPEPPKPDTIETRFCEDFATISARNV